MILDNYGEVIANANLENYNTYGIKSSCEYLIRVESINKLLDLVTYLDNKNMDYLVLGKGSNIILPDTKFKGVIISLEKLNNLIIDDNYVEVECGIALGNLVQEVVNHDLKGLEDLSGIPGTLGGALYGNAGFSKDITIYNYLEKVVVIRNHQLVEIPKKDIELDYRYSSFKNSHDILVKATFKLSKGSKSEMLEIIKKNREKRVKTQPLEFKNAGSVFKNPEGFSAGKLIQDANLKGYHINDAYVSEKHANFIINKGNATSEDIKKLIKVIQEKVLEKYNITLELEQNIIEWD